MTHFLLSTFPQYAWIIIGVTLGFILLSGVFCIFLTAFIIFRKTLHRDPKQPRFREISSRKVKNSALQPAIQHMIDEGIIWSKQYEGKIDDLHIVNDQLNLYGQYIDLGFDKCAIIVQGRTESLLYSYYFANAYAKSGYNILVIDTRAHGLSDGKYITAGIQEHRDLVKWIKLVKEKYGMEHFVIHGICIGAAGAIYAHEALMKENNENSGLIKKLVLDGAFTSYYEIFRQHHLERKKPVFPFVHLIFFFVFMHTGARFFKFTPLKSMANIDIPTLFIFSKEDIYCTPEKTKELFDASPSKNKELRLFPKGKHSHVRINQPNEYDRVIEEFLNK